LSGSDPCEQNEDRDPAIFHCNDYVTSPQQTTGAY